MASVGVCQSINIPTKCQTEVTEAQSGEKRTAFHVEGMIPFNLAAVNAIDVQIVTGGILAL